jgi:Nitrile hydratase, alpha chain
MSDKAHPAYAKVIAKAWANASYRQQLVSNPKAALKAEGWELPDNVNVTVQPDSNSSSLVLGIPPRPAGIGDDQLERHSKDFAAKCCCCL